MNDDEILTLMMLLTSERRLQAGQVGEGLTGRIDRESARVVGMAALRSLERQGAARRIAGPHSPWEITEKGRIAAALLMHKNPDLRQIFIDDWETAGPQGSVESEAPPDAGAGPTSAR